MNSLKETCLELIKTKDAYTKFKEEKSIIRKKCDEKIKEEMKEFRDTMNDIAECADILLDNFSHYGAVIRFPISVTEKEEDVISVCFAQENYSLTRNSNDELLYKSDQDIDEFPISSYEYIIVNRAVIIDKITKMIQSFLQHEIDTMNKSMTQETAYYDRLCDSLFSDEEE
ncbi:MAG: hypothetical protein J6A25_03590 [Lachnospiraceae bacterium]|nr:hypothetical protein [Lachnospiraceae bacterium]